MDAAWNTPFGPGNFSTGQRVTADFVRNTVLDDAICPSEHTGCGNIWEAWLEDWETVHLNGGFSRTACAELCNDHPLCTGFLMEHTYGTCILTGDPECTPSEDCSVLYYKLENCALGMKNSIRQ